jgi:hypothetical protein
VSNIRQWLPVCLLLGVASLQVTLTRTADLSPWKGGGFGMFASTDGSAFRRTRIFVEGPDRSEELEIPPSLERAGARAALFPSGRFMSALARGVEAREQRHGRAVTTVRVEVWRIDFGAPSDSATERQLCTFTLRSRP